ncbi:MAG TPA: thioredoxin-disulfide reductase [Patescibacteria group bacterium]
MSNNNLNNVIIIGGGIAAHTAAIYTARASLKPLVISAAEPDQLSLTTTVENWPGYVDGVQGPELIADSKKQAQKFGAEYISGQVNSVKKTEEGFDIIAGDKSFQTKTVIIATGASARRLNIPGEDQYFGRGVSTCAVCDAALFRDKDVVVVGGGDSAMEETLALYKFARSIKLIHRRDAFKASQIMRDRVLGLTDKVEILYSHQALEVLGDGKFVTGVKVKDLKNDKDYEIAVNGMFLAIGHTPNTKFLEGLVELDDQGYIVTDKRSRTSVEGIYAAGDVQDPIFRQAITSAGAGCQAALEAERHIENRQ